MIHRIPEPASYMPIYYTYYIINIGRGARNATTEHKWKKKIL